MGSCPTQTGISRKQSWIAHMGNVCVKDEQSPFCSTAATSSSRPRGEQDGARRSSQGRPFRVAAQRLGLELSEHAIMLVPVGNDSNSSYWRFGQGIICNPRICDQGTSRLCDLGCLPDQTHI